MIKGSGLTGKVIEVTINDSESMRRVRVEDLLNLMCREFARCLRTLKQAPVEHQCASIGTKEIANSHLELMVMQLQREFFFLFFFSFFFLPLNERSVNFCILFTV